jgi:hypothetical protein
MSSMSLLEKNARYAVAISILNSFRHWLIGRANADFNNEDKAIFLESIDMNQDKKLSPKMILYSFRGFSNNEHSAAIELSDALCDALKITFNKTDEQENYLIKLKVILESMDKNEISEEDRNSIIDLIINTMQVISNQTEQKPDNTFAWKSL